MTLELKAVGKFDMNLRLYMQNHYTQPKGFIGRSIQYLIYYDGVLYGAITGNSPIQHLVGRLTHLYEYYHCKMDLDFIVNNQFFHIDKSCGRYPTRNFASKVLDYYKQKISEDWKHKYGFPIVFFETLVEPPRTGELYIRNGWDYLGMTKGFTCKRGGGAGTDNYTGKRIWNLDKLKPKHIFMQRNTIEEIPKYLKYIPMFTTSKRK
jgi:hypothetical protein